jgi:hypothetical protein
MICQISGPATAQVSLFFRVLMGLLKVHDNGRHSSGLLDISAGVIFVGLK